MDPKESWFKKLGFDYNPFNIKPSYFFEHTLDDSELIDNIVSELENGNSAFLKGEYGTGKTTVINKIISDLGENTVIYYSCEGSENPIPIEKLLISKNNFLFRLFRIKKKGVILALDEAQKISLRDIKKVESYVASGHIKAVLFVASNDEFELLNTKIKGIVDENMFKTKELTKEIALEIVRDRIGDLDIITDEAILKIFSYNKNPRKFLKNCEKVFKSCFDENLNEISVQFIDKTLLN
jgi:DNA helicase TIP49 (TBP-interacting protein)